MTLPSRINISNLIEKLGIVKDIGDIRITQAKMNGDLALMMERINQNHLSLVEDITAQKHTLFGNGQPGMVDTVKTVNDWMKAQIEREKNSRAVWLLLWGALIVNAVDIISRHLPIKG